MILIFIIIFYYLINQNYFKYNINYNNIKAKISLIIFIILMFKSI